jgi:pyruvate dehydrogenase E2 component (dihydrolipoamide acetyltransferase)
MATPIEMPKLGNTVEECLLAHWLKKTGDVIAEGDLVAEIETDKATFELTATAAGTLLGTFFQEGELVPVFANICVVGSPGESIEPFRPQKISVAAGTETQSVKPVARSAPASAVTAGADAPISFSPRAKKFAEEHHFYPKGISGTGPGGRVLEEDLEQLYYNEPRNSLLASKLIENGFEARGEGAGINGMFMSGDLIPPPARISGIREKIARRMKDSLSSTAQYTLNMSAEATGLISLRARIKKRCEQGTFPSISINDMVMFSVIRALESAPEMNVEFVDGKIYQCSNINLGFACDTPRGLLAPVIHESQKLNIAELADKVKLLTRQAVEGSIDPKDISGGSFTVSNLGILGIESFTPILNPPQVAILGVNAIELKPVRRNGVVEFIEHIGLSLTCDHQVIDGAPGAKFLKSVKEKIENIEIIAGIDLPGSAGVPPNAA